MLNFSLVSEAVVEIEEVSYSFTDTRRYWWYYDFINWRVSSHGTKDDTPDRDMTELSKQYFKKWHMPKVTKLLGEVI